MKLRRALVTVASTAAIAPAALMATPAAFADTPPYPAPSQSSPAIITPPPGAQAPVNNMPGPTPRASTMPSSAPSASTAPKPSTPPSTEPSAPPSQPQDCEVQNPTYKAAVITSIEGLPGKIVAGSGWHKFTLSVHNPTSKGIKDIALVAGVGPLDGDNPFTLKQAVLQAYDGKHWFDVTEDGTFSMGLLDRVDDLQSGDTWDYPLRLNVTSSAPIGKGLTIGAGVYQDTKNDCVATSVGLYRIDIVAPGTPTKGTTPKPVPLTGGKTPLPKSVPSKPSTGGSNAPQPQATGTLAHTGAPSQLPVIAGIGGAAIVAGAGAMFVVRRRKANAQA